MRKYFCAQLKRLLRIFLPILLVTAILFGCLMVVFDIISSLNEESKITTKYKIGVVGTASDFYLQMGLKAMESIDSTRLSIELVEMEEKAAEDAMRKGTIAAFVVFPDGFLDAAFRGDIIPLKLVSTAGAVGFVSLVKDEFSQLLEIMLLEAQKGIYGSGDAMNSLGLSSSKVVNDISIAYAEFVFSRGNIYRASTLEAFDGLGVVGYLITGLCIIMFMLVCLTFAPMMIRRDHALGRMLCAQGRSIIAQTLCDFGVYLLALAGIAAVVLAYVVFGMHADVTALMLLQGLPVLLVLGAMSFLMYELASDLVSGVLLQFFTVLVLCFISGCLYPITFFPEAIQKLSAFLPTGIARIQIANLLLQSFDLGNTLAALGYTGVFLTAAVLTRRFKTAGVRG